MRVVHEAACPEISPPLCAEQSVPTHLHDQRIRWFRFSPALNVGLGKGWQAGLQVPFDVRAMSVDYLTLDGSEPYVPPYGDIHHRDEVLAGPVDGRLTAWRYARAGSWTLGAGAGTTLPLGRTEEDPYARTEEGLEHQHFQLGSGTFDPVVGAQAILAPSPVGLWVAVDARLPLYENRKGYRPPASLGGSVGPLWQVVDPLQLLPTIEGLFETPERWSGTPYGGRVAVLGGLAAVVDVGGGVVLQGQARATAWQVSVGEEEGEPMRQALVLTAGASVSF